MYLDSVQLTYRADHLQTEPSQRSQIKSDTFNLVNIVLLMCFSHTVTWSLYRLAMLLSFSLKAFFYFLQPSSLVSLNMSCTQIVSLLFYRHILINISLIHLLCLPPWIVSCLLSLSWKQYLARVNHRSDCTMGRGENVFCSLIECHTGLEADNRVTPCLIWFCFLKFLTFIGPSFFNL